MIRLQLLILSDHGSDVEVAAKRKKCCLSFQTTPVQRGAYETPCPRCPPRRVERVQGKRRFPFRIDFSFGRTNCDLCGWRLVGRTDRALNVSAFAGPRVGRACCGINAAREMTSIAGYTLGGSVSRGLGRSLGFVAVMVAALALARGGGNEFVEVRFDAG